MVGSNADFTNPQIKKALKSASFCYLEPVADMFCTTPLPKNGSNFDKTGLLSQDLIETNLRAIPTKKNWS